MVGAHARVLGDAENRIIPHQAHGIPVLSMGHLVEAGQPIAWRGPMLHKMINQFLYGAKWGELDYLLLDLPPGTGDVQMSLAQSAPIAGAVLVTTPQEVALRDVEKGLEMFRSMKVPVLGIIENMSYYLCGSCSKKHYIFGKGGGKRMADDFQLPLLGEIPLDARIPSPMGKGQPLVVSDRDSELAASYRNVAGRVVAELSRLSGRWAEAGPGAMEV
jgi:ATP-binding protein involved in chromosome partitioning